MTASIGWCEEWVIACKVLLTHALLGRGPLHKICPGAGRKRAQRWRCSGRLSELPPLLGQTRTAVSLVKRGVHLGLWCLSQSYCWHMGQGALLNCPIWGNTSPCGECLWNDTMVLNICFAFGLHAYALCPFFSWCERLQTCQNPAFYRYHAELLCSTCREYHKSSFLQNDVNQLVPMNSNPFLLFFFEACFLLKPKNPL